MHVYFIPAPKQAGPVRPWRFQILIFLFLLNFQVKKRKLQSGNSKPKASLTASHSSTVAEELVALLRHLHSFNSWNPLINDFISTRLNSIAETASQPKVNITGRRVKTRKLKSEHQGLYNDTSSTWLKQSKITAKNAENELFF